MANAIKTQKQTDGFIKAGSKNGFDFYAIIYKGKALDYAVRVAEGSTIDEVHSAFQRGWLVDTKTLQVI